MVIDGAVNGIKASTHFTTFITNNQALFIRNCTGYGIENLGIVINNYDRLFIENTTNFSIYNQVSGGDLAQLYNYAGARLIAKNGIHNNIQTIVNEGYMECIGMNNTALIAGTFTNNDSLVISSHDQVGIEINKVFTNNANGIVVEDVIEMSTTNITFIFGRGELINHGVIDIDLQNEAPGIYLGPKLSANPSENTGEIKVTNAAVYGITFNGITFNNHETGSIQVLATNGNGMTMQGGESLINQGDISIEDVTSGTGFQLISFAKLENSGTLSLKNFQGGTGYFFYSNDVVNNAGGLINVFHKGSDYAMKVEVPFLNEGTVSIYMQGTAIKALRNIVKITNKGDFNINEQNNEATYSSLENTFLNDTCGLFKSEISVKLLAGDSLINHGLMVFNQSGEIQNTGGKVLNYGIVQSLEKYIDYNWFDINQGVIINQWFHSLDAGYTYGAPMSCNPSFTLLDGTWYADPLYTIPIGTFQGATGAFACTQSTTADKLSFPVDFYGKCVRKIEILLFPNTSPNCINIRFPVFDGSVSNSWMVSQNWNDNILPDACSKATIPSGQNVTLTAGSYGEAESITVETGAVFEAEPTSVLKVD